MPSTPACENDPDCGWCPRIEYAMRVPLPPGLAEQIRDDATVNELALLYFEQGARCAICAGPLWRGGMVLDHDHANGFIRGWLCRSCNVREPYCHDPHVNAYRANPPGRNRWPYTW